MKTRELTHCLMLPDAKKCDYYDDDGGDDEDDGDDDDDGDNDDNDEITDSRYRG